MLKLMTLTHLPHSSLPQKVISFAETAVSHFSMRLSRAERTSFHHLPSYLSMKYEHMHHISVFSFKIQHFGQKVSGQSATDNCQSDSDQNPGMSVPESLSCLLLMHSFEKREAV